MSDPSPSERVSSASSPFVRAADGTRLYFTDHGKGEPIVFLSSAAVGQELWWPQHCYFADAGYRVIAYDRRGHGRSDQPGQGYDYDTLAHDLGRVLEVLDLRHVTLVGHSFACGEIVRYLTQHRSLARQRVARIALVAGTTPCLGQRSDNPEGIAPEAFVALQQSWARDFPAWVVENEPPFFLPHVSAGTRRWAIQTMMTTPARVAIAINRTLALADFRTELRTLELPTLVVHGTADVSAPFALCGERCAALIRGAQLRIYEGAPHGLMFTHTDQLNADLHAFVRNLR